MSKLYRIERHMTLYVEADSIEEAKEAAEEDYTVYTEYEDDEPEEVDSVSTGLGFTILPRDEE
jgi:hypothetical protein